MLIQLTLLRELYLRSGIHDFLYEKTNGLYNGYLVLGLLLALVKAPLWLIGLILLGRYIYRHTVVINPMLNTLIFMLGIYICLKLLGLPIL